MSKKILVRVSHATIDAKERLVPEKFVIQHVETYCLYALTNHVQALQKITIEDTINEVYIYFFITTFLTILVNFKGV
uniref:Uncharacterized protein n=1 Tax=Trichobilharzia regenti TaxID=157069 RepID=A0AA85ISD4_TRIRE|nr:unnamed protein product [Trichobilharzia regenti]